MYGDNRDVPVTVTEKVKYHPHIASTVKVFKSLVRGENLRVADIGARDGYSTELLKLAGYYVDGTELILDYVIHAQQRGRLVVQDDFMDTRLPEREYDAVFSRHCLEHCSSTVKFFDTCARILKPDGVVFLTFPLETSAAFNRRKYPGINHMVNYPDKESFRNVVRKTRFKEMLFGKSKRYGIMPDGKEVLFFGRLLPD